MDGKYVMKMRYTYITKKTTSTAMSPKRTFGFSFQAKEYSGQKTCKMILGKCGVHIIWRLAKEGKLSIYSLHRNNKGRIKYVLSKPINACYSGGDYVGEESDYSYPFIHKTIGMLEKKGLVRISEDSTGIRKRRLVELTLLGLLVYFDGSEEKDEFSKSLEKNLKIIPFHGIWKTLVERLGNERVLDALKATVKEMAYMNPITIKVKGMSYDGYSINDLRTHVDLTRDQSVAEILLKKEASFLRNSYMVYLLLKFRSMPNNACFNEKSGSDAKDHLDQELRYFKDKLKTRDLPVTGHETEFLREHSTLEALFTGVFTDNLLWRKTQNTEDDKTYDL